MARTAPVKGPASIDVSGGIPSNLYGTTPPGYTSAYGGAPIIPNPGATALQATGENTLNFPGLSNLANAYNLANYNTQAQEVAGTPGFQNVLSNLNAQVPQDVIGQLIQTGAERGVQTGMTGSPNQNAAIMRALGLTSIDLQNLGQQQYGALLGHFPMAAPFDMQSMMVTPEAQQGAAAAANVSAAAPNPYDAAQAEMDALLKAIQAGKTGGPTIPPFTPPAAGPGANTNTPGAGPGLQGGGPGTTTSTGKGNFWDQVAAALGIGPGWQPSGAAGGAGAVQTPPGGGVPGGIPPAAGGGGVDTGGGGAEPWALGGTSPDVQSFMQTLFGAPAYGQNKTQGLGLDPVLNALLGQSPPPQYGPGAQPPGTGYDPFTDSSINAPWLTGNQGSFSDQFGQFMTGQDPWASSEQQYWDSLLNPDAASGAGATPTGYDNTIGGGSGFYDQFGNVIPFPDSGATPIDAGVPDWAGMFPTAQDFGLP